jgi:hypothetical protein
MVRPCVARAFFDLFFWSRVNVSGLSLERLGAPGHHGYQRVIDLFSRQASLGHLVHQVSITLGRPFAISLFALADLGRIIPVLVLS